MSAFCLMILVGISRSWEAFEASISRVTSLTSLRLTFLKENPQPEFRSFILRMLGCFPKVFIAFSIGLLFFGNFTAFNVKTIYDTVKIRPKDFRNFVLFRKSCINFNEYYFFTLQCLFSEAWFYGFPDRLIIGNRVYVKVIIKVPFCLLNKFSTKIVLPFIL